MPYRVRWVAPLKVHETMNKIQEVYSPNVKITLGICFGVKVAIHSLPHHESSKIQSSTLIVKIIYTNSNSNTDIQFVMSMLKNIHTNLPFG